MHLLWKGHDMCVIRWLPGPTVCSSHGNSHAPTPQYFAQLRRETTSHCLLRKPGWVLPGDSEGREVLLEAAVVGVLVGDELLEPALFTALRSAFSQSCRAAALVAASL